MTFTKCDEIMGPGVYVSLAGDGDTMDVVFVAEPEPRESTFRGKIRRQFLFPVVTEVGLRVLSRGVKDYKRIRDNWKKIFSRAVRITRQGAAGDSSTRYKMDLIDRTKVLDALVKQTDSEGINEMLRQVMGTPIPDETFQPSMADDSDIPF